MRRSAKVCRAPRTLADAARGAFASRTKGSCAARGCSDPTDAGAGPEPTDWAGFPVADPPASTGRYDVDALRITVLGVLDPLDVTLDLARSSVGSNVLG